MSRPPYPMYLYARSAGRPPYPIYLYARSASRPPYPIYLYARSASRPPYPIYLYAGSASRPPSPIYLCAGSAGRPPYPIYLYAGSASTLVVIVPKHEYHSRAVRMETTPLTTYMTIKVTILSAQPLIPPKRLYAQKVQACFDMY